jgi:hypothetical protein
MSNTMRWTAGAALLAVAASLCALAFAAVGLHSLCPSSNTVAGWTAMDADKLAASPDELWKIYNGGDGEWKVAGVTSAFRRYYKNAQTNHILTLDINKTGTDWQKAKALYRSKNDGIRKQAGYQTVTLKQEGALATPVQGLKAHFWNKYYYCSIEINGTSAADVSAAKQFMLKVADNITKNG